MMMTMEFLVKGSKFFVQVIFISTFPDEEENSLLKDYAGNTILSYIVKGVLFFFGYLVRLVNILLVKLSLLREAMKKMRRSLSHESESDNRINSGTLLYRSVFPIS